MAIQHLNICTSVNALYNVQSNLVNSMSSGLDVLFRIISSSNYRAVDINSPKMFSINFFYQT